MSQPDRPCATVAECLRLGRGFSPEERAHVVDRLGKLDHHLRSFPAEAVSLDLGVKDRHTAQQRVVLEARLPLLGALVATSTLRDLDDALMDVRADMVRRIDAAKKKHEPNHNRHLRAV